MAQNVTLMGASFSDVPSVELPKTGGGTASFTDVSDTTAEASDVAAGEYFYDSSGTRTLGTASGGSRCTWYGTCSTSESTATKAVTCSNFTLETGAFVAVLFTTANTAATPKLNVNSTGDVSIYVGTSTPSSTTNVLKWSANTLLYFIYDGTYFRYLGSMAAGDVVQPDGAGCWYGTSSTTASTQTKTTTIANFRLTKGAIVAVRFSTANTYMSAAVKLNVNSTGAKNIYTKSGATSSSNTLTWEANTVLLFIFDGSYWRYLGSDRDGGGSYTLPTASDSTKGGVKINLDQMKMNGEVLELVAPPRSVWFDPSTSAMYGSYADVYSYVTAGAAGTLWVCEYSETGDPNDPDTAILYHPVTNVMIDDNGDGQGLIELRFSRWHDVYMKYVDYAALLEESTDEWTIDVLIADTLVEDVEISIPSTASGSNASNKSAYTQTSGYSPIGVVGYDWASGGTRNNFFNFYKMDVSTANKQVIVSACNLHSSSAASGTVIVMTLMKRDDLI